MGSNVHIPTVSFVSFVYFNKLTLPRVAPALNCLA